MNAFFYSVLTSRELPDGLEFRVDRMLGKGLTVAYPAICLFFAVLGLIAYLTQEYPPESVIGIGIGAAINLAAWPLLMVLGRMNRTTTLVVTSQSVRASGRGVGSNQWSSATITVPISEVTWIGYLPSNSKGLYLSRGFMNNACILPGLNAEQADSVTDAILRRFPNLRSKMQPNRRLAETRALPPA